METNNKKKNENMNNNIKVPKSSSLGYLKIIRRHYYRIIIIIIKRPRHFGHKISECLYIKDSIYWTNEPLIKLPSFLWMESLS